VARAAFTCGLAGAGSAANMTAACSHNQTGWTGGGHNAQEDSTRERRGARARRCARQREE
jgi:hypothetical protein